MRVSIIIDVSVMVWVRVRVGCKRSASVSVQQHATAETDILMYLNFRFSTENILDIKFVF